MNQKHLWNLTTSLALLALSATGFAAELLSADQKLSAELKEYTLATDSTTTEYTMTDSLKTDSLVSGSLATGSLTTVPAEVTVIVRY